MRAAALNHLLIVLGIASTLITSTAAEASEPWVCGGKTQFLGECARCVSSEQCKDNASCCPRLKLCMGPKGCPAPWGNCNPYLFTRTASELKQEQWDASNCSGSTGIPLRNWVDCSATIPAVAVSLWNAATIAFVLIAFLGWLS
uniref:Transmembrane protein n=1 Tax=Neospora caninum (strain Liverpool) TaxID=572307 RepID=A0A0F7UP27_NEOCL|nr:TPA: hypothetical protein BN1204_059123 [Neospora caninum Liverpool]